MLPFVRKLPHPTYGAYGGAHNECKKLKVCPKPVDWMDEAFANHDKDLKAAKNQKQINAADNALAKKLRNRNDRKFFHKIWGPIYWSGAKIIFRIKF